MRPPADSGAAAGEPTLPELLHAAWGGWGSGARATGVIAAALLVAAAIAFALASRGESYSHEGGEAAPFSISWSELDRVGPRPGELLRLERRDGDHVALSLAVLPLRPPPPPRLGIAAERVRRQLEARHPGARVVLEGRTLLAVDRGPEAYQLAFAAPAEGRSPGGGGEATLIGKRFLVPDPDRPGAGVQIEIAERTAKPGVVEKVERAPAGFFGNWPIQLLLEDAVSVRTAEGLEQPLRSFRFG